MRQITLRILGTLVCVLLTGCAANNFSAELTEEWIKTTPTYAFDGRDLELLDHAIEGKTQIFIYRFTSTQGGYGDRSEEMTAQMLTDHTIEIIIENGNIVSAIIDGMWDELQQEHLQGTETLSLQPMQCEQTPWEIWATESMLIYQDEEAIIAYYEKLFDIPIINASKVEPDRMVCMACSICPTVHYFEIEVETYYTEILRQHGWQ
jgi:hypothetical protein